MLQYKNLCLLLTTTQTSRRLCLLLEGCPKKSFSVVVSWRSSFHRKNRLAEKSFSVVGRQQAEGLVLLNYMISHTKLVLTTELLLYLPPKQGRKFSKLKSMMNVTMSTEQVRTRNVWKVISCRKVVSKIERNIEREYLKIEMKHVASTSSGRRTRANQMLTHCTRTAQSNFARVPRPNVCGNNHGVAVIARRNGSTSKLLSIRTLWRAA